MSVSATPPAKRGDSAMAAPGAASRASLVAIRGISKQFANGTLAVREVNLDLHQGEFISLLGPSGCGKSTLLRMIAGLSQPSAGTIEWLNERLKPGHDTPGNPGRDLGFVFQDPTLMPWSQAIGNVAMPLILKGVGKAEAHARSAEMLELVGLKGFEKSYPRELSGGMKMRVSIARAMVTKPSLLLMDEPFAALDEMTRFKLNNDTLALRQDQGFTTVFVTHSVFESVYLSNRVIVLAARPGRVIADIAIDEPYPRSDAFRSTTRYAQWCVQVSQALQQAGEHYV